MATIQSAYFKGLSRPNVPVPHKAGTVHEVLVTHVVSEDVDTTDILELVPIPPNARLLQVDYASENITTITLDIGIMTGAAGDPTTVRTIDDALLTTQAVATPASVPLATIAAIGVAGEARSIGVVPSAKLTKGATKKIHLRVRYAGAS